MSSTIEGQEWEVPICRLCQKKIFQEHQMLENDPGNAIIEIDREVFNSLLFLVKMDCDGLSQVIANCIEQRFEGNWDVESLREWFDENEVRSS